MTTKADPFKNKQRLEKWKDSEVLKTRYCKNPLSKINRTLVLNYLEDMELGYNVGRKGKRSAIRLNTIRQRIVWVLENIGIDDITKATRKEVLVFFNNMQEGKILTHKGKQYKSTLDYINIFKAFWHWYQRTQREINKDVQDITIDLDTSNRKESDFVYFEINDLKKVINHSKYEYRIMMWFLFDSGIRSPTELTSLRVADFHYLKDKGIYELDIRDEYAKTFGRRIKLVLSSDILISYLKDKEGNEPFFNIDWKSFTRYLKRIFVKTLGDKKTKGGKSFKEIRAYDFRHSSACYWLIRYKNESAFKYRFGWKENNMIHYYTNMLGMTDTITQEDILVDSDAKSKLEKELEIQKKNSLLMEERFQAEREQMKHQMKHFKETIMEDLTKEIFDKINKSKLTKGKIVI
jgi:integrase